MPDRTAQRGDPFDLFAIVAPGLEEIAAEELRQLGVREPAIEAGGVGFRGGADLLYRTNLGARTVSRIVATVGEFSARSFAELERLAGRLPWERFLTPGTPVALRVTCRKSKLYHSDAVAERVARVVEERVGAGVVSVAAAAERSEGEPATAAGGAAPELEGDAEGENDEQPPDRQLVIVRFLHDRCTVRADSSGALLHQRGYRQAIGKAPMRETLAAALLAASGWAPESPLLDPLCGSGTIAIEAALRARRIAPGIARRFAFMHWPAFDEALWRATVAAARSAELPAAPAPIQASDRDAGAIESAQANAERAGVAGDIAFTVAPLSRIQPPHGPGWVVTNPPYGVRVGDRDRLRNLYAQLGNVLRSHCLGWTLALLSAEPALERQIGFPLEPVLRTRNGGIPVRVMRGFIV